MKYAIALLLLAGCASAPKPAPIPTRLYSCSLFNHHGSYATLTVYRSTVEEAYKDAQTVRDRLEKMELIPTGCDMSCE